MNVDLLKSLYQIFSPSGETKKMRKYLKRAITARGGTYVQDKRGNLLVTKGKADTYPCLASHIDQVRHHTHPKDFKVVCVDNILMGWSTKMKQQCGLGADDKNGVFICLNALEKYDNIKVAFFVDEEIGCQGSEEVDLSFFDDVRFVIEPDRKGGHDYISAMSGVTVCSDDFAKAVDYEAYGYKFEEGSITDVLTLLERGLKVSCLNLSCGYYHPHTDEEVTVISELENCQNLVFEMIDKMTDVYPFEYVDMRSWSGKNKDYYYEPSTRESEDFDIMDDLLSEDPTMSFDDIMCYSSMFYTKNESDLKKIFDEVAEWYADYREPEDSNDKDDADSKLLVDWNNYRED